MREAAVMVTLASLVLALATLRGVDPSLMGPGYSQLQLHTPPGHVDTWTRRETGCACPDTGGLACPCCNQGGCPCPRHGRCVQCGLEAACAGGQYDHLDTSYVLSTRQSWAGRVI